MHRGYFHVWRKLIWSEEWLAMAELPGGFPRPCAWIDLIGLANHKDGQIRTKRNIRVPVVRGQVGWSIKSLAKRWGWSTTKVKCFLNELSDDSQIVPQKNNVTSIITIVNYDQYQAKVPQNVPHMSRKSPAEVPQSVPNKNELIKEAGAPPQPELIELPMTETEKQWLVVLGGIKGYPLKEPLDLANLRALELEFPEVDVFALLKAWAAYKIDKPLTAKSSPRAQLRNQFALAKSKGLHKRERSNGNGKKPLDQNEIIKQAEERFRQEVEA